MAVITQIELANYLGEGFKVDGRRDSEAWNPLYRAVTLPLRGQSTAIQIENGDGKSSISEGCLYLLSRDRRLKEKLFSRCAPSENGWSHIRIEFGIKDDSDNILQQELITESAEDFPGITYVVGLCANRDKKDVIFYIYSGTLIDAPIFVKNGTGVALIDNDVFRKSVERINGSKWNKWATKKDWENEIKQFIDIEVIRQNVEFQVTGAGDASAMLHNIKQQPGESFDAAFFRQLIAPELLKNPAPDELKNPMGNEEKEEKGFEDTLLKTLQTVSSTMVEIASKEAEYENATDALSKFEPVIEKAEVFITADNEYKSELTSIIDDVAIIHEIAIVDPIPGVPKIDKFSSWIKDKNILEVLSHMVIDKREGVLISDYGMAKLIGADIGRINEYAANNKIKSTECDLQVIDLKDVLKKDNIFIDESIVDDDSSQVVDLKDDLKKNGRGGRRYSVKGYTIISAINLLNVTKNLNTSRLPDAEDSLKKAFGIAMTEIDTNPYRIQLNKLSSQLNQAKSDCSDAEENVSRCQKQIENLESQRDESDANKTAYEDFFKRKSEFPEYLHSNPSSAHEWAKAELESAKSELSTIERKIGELTDKYNLWKKLVAENGLINLKQSLSNLNSEHSKLTDDKNKTEKEKTTIQEKKENQKTLYESESTKLQGLTSQSQKLEEIIKVQLPIFINLFGDVDPTELNPQESLNKANETKNKLTKENADCQSLCEKFEHLKPDVELFRSIFTNEDVDSLNPVEALNITNAKIRAEEYVISEHQKLADALTCFKDLNDKKTPAEWLDETSKKREELREDKKQNAAKIIALNGELSDLEKYSVADDRVYSHALKLIESKNIIFDRLYDVIKSATSGNRQNDLLTLFSSALSAPVVTSIDDAESTTALLENERATVPVFLKDELLKFIKDGHIESIGKLAFNFLVGRRTRQVEILLNPNLIIEEKDRIKQEIENFEQVNKNIDFELLNISEDSDKVCAVKMAQDAISKDSVNKCNNANKELEQLQKTLPELEKRASPKAVSSIDQMKRFIDLGGDEKFNHLQNTELNRLKAQLDDVSDEIEKLKKQTTDEANNARIAAVEFKTFGGHDEFKKLSEKINSLASIVNELNQSIQDLTTQADDQYKKFNSATDKLSEFEKTYYVNKKELEVAIQFEEDGNVVFMRGAEENTKNAKEKRDSSIGRLSGIDFDKAQRYLDSKDSSDSDIDITQRIADAKANKKSASDKVTQLRKEIEKFNVEIANLKPFMEDIHELVVNTLNHLKKISSLAQDVRQKSLMAKTINHEVKSYAEEVRLFCLLDKSGTSDENKASIKNLKVCIDDLRIDTQSLSKSNKSKQKAYDDFAEKRAEFCNKARNNEIKGLNHLEVERIENAKTIEELNKIKDLKELIQTQINDKKVDLEKAKSLAEESKKASINNMAKFARQAETNLKLMERVMQKTPSGRFYIDVQIADDERVTRLVESLLNEIQDREKSYRERSNVLLNDDIVKRKDAYRTLVRDSIYRNLFINPSVEFSHTGIWDGARKPMNNEMSKGQITALHLMWMIKQAEYSLQLVASRYSSKKERYNALKNSQRILFFDGLFSNLSNDNIIDDAFQGLKFVGENFQLIGLLHHPRYVNNPEIFPVHLVGKRFKNVSDTKKRGFMAIEPWQKDGDMAMFASFFKRKADDIHV